MNQLGLFDAPVAPPPATAPRPAAPFVSTKPKARAKREPEPVAPPCVVAQPQLPPEGALGKIGERWHRWRGRVGICGEAMGWEPLKPRHHAAHASDSPPRLNSKGEIAEPYPPPATVHFGGHTLRVEWSEYGFSVYSGERFLLHFSKVAGCAVAAAEIARGDEHFQSILANLTEPEPGPDGGNDDQPDEPQPEPDDDEQPDEWRFEWRGLSVIGTSGPCFQIDRERHPEGTPCWSETGFRSFCGDAWRLAPPVEGRERSTVEWSLAILDAYFAAPAKDGNGLGGKLVPWAVPEWQKPKKGAAPDLAPAKPQPEPEPLHPLHQGLVDAELISTYHAVTGATLQDPKHDEREAPWNAPSRLFRFPCTFHLPKGDEPARLLIWSERIAEHPFVREIAAATGIEPTMAEGSDAWGFSQKHGMYHHAVDLISDGRWQQLLDLRDFTDADSIVSAVCYGLDYGHLKAGEAQQILTAIGVGVPTNPSPVDALRVVSLGECKGESGKLQRTTNWMSGPGRDCNAWARIAGIERGWFKMRGSFLTWTDKAKVEQDNLKIAAGETVAPVPVREGHLL